MVDGAAGCPRGVTLTSVERSLGEVHHRNEAEFAQGRGEGFFRSLVQNASGVLAVFDADGTVAGVETEAQARLLGEMGCDFGQGFYFAKPLPPEAMSEYLAR